jgi:hypothetical protein
MSPEQGQPQQWGNQPPPPPGQGYGGGGGYGGAVKPSNGLGIAALILGILALPLAFVVFGGLLGLIAVILGFIARGKAKRGEATNGGVALGGIITGIIAMLISLAIVAAAVIFANSTIAECLTDAGEDQVKVEQCQREFADRHAD